MNSFVDNLIKREWLKTPHIIEAFKKIKRHDFMTNDMKEMANLNQPLSIGYGQTISQPLVVAFMLELLQPQKGEKVLDVGAGSGWTTALLSEIVGKSGKVIAIEAILDLKEFGEANVDKYGFVKNNIAKFIYGDGRLGYKDFAPYNKILCSAAAQKEIPSAWRAQLKTGGRIAAPIDNSIWLFVKKSDKKFESTEYPGFAFVPLVDKIK